METQHTSSLQDEDSNLFPEDPFSDIPESSEVQHMISTPMALSNTFSQVVFPSIPDFFPPGKDINIAYILSEVLTPSSRDWVGIFRVGWTSPREYTTYVWAPKPPVGSAQNSSEVTFYARQLPGDDNEFYQMCYVTKQGKVRGASTPFQFRLCTENDCLVEVEDENGLIILRTRSDDLEEKLGAVTKEKNELVVKLDEFIKKNDDLNQSIESWKKELHEKEFCLENEKKQNSCLSEQIKDKDDQIRLISEALSNARQQITDNQKQMEASGESIANLNKKIKQMEEELVSLQTKMKEEEGNLMAKILKRDQEMNDKNREYTELLQKLEDLNLVKEDLSQKSENEKTEYMQVMNNEQKKLKRKLEAFKDERDLFQSQLNESELGRITALQCVQTAKSELQEAQDKIKAYELSLSDSKESILELERTLAALKIEYKREKNELQDAVRNSSEKVNAMEASKRLLREELTEAANSRDKLMSDLHKSEKDKMTFAEQDAESQSIIQSLRQQVADLEKEKSVCVQLQVQSDKTSAHLQKRLTELEDVTLDREECLEEQTEALNKLRADSDKTQTQLTKRVTELEKLLEDREQRLQDQSEALNQQQLQAGAAERNLENRIDALQSQLRDSDASLIRLIDSTSQQQAVTSDGTRQQIVVDSDDDEDDDVDEVNEQIQKAQDKEIKDLQKQVSDLTTRLNMGAVAYKDKAMECIKLEKKVKKMELRMKMDKEKQEAQQRSSDPSSSSGEMASSPRPDSAGIMDTIEKLLISFADPDSELEQQDTVNLQQKELEKMRKAFQTEHARYRKYKSLYLELKSNYDITVKHHTEITQLLADQQKKYQITLDENLMLRQHISELDLTPQAEGSSIGGRGATETAADEEVVFQDAPGDPMYSTSDRSSSSSSEETSETRAHIYQELSNKFNFCPDESDVAPVVQTSSKRTKPKPIKKKPVVSQQPIRSPPSIVELLETTVSQTHSSPSPSSSSLSPKSNGEMRRRSSGNKNSKKKMKSSVKRRSHTAAAP